MNEEPISTANEKANVILVCLSPSPSNARVIHAGAKMINAYTENATALYV
jgi:two-component system sensor histidine kinase KdpD